MFYCSSVQLVNMAVVSRYRKIAAHLKRQARSRSDGVVRTVFCCMTQSLRASIGGVMSSRLLIF
jgi:hypothetical protein